MMTFRVAARQRPFFVVAVRRPERSRPRRSERCHPEPQAERVRLRRSLRGAEASFTSHGSGMAAQAEARGSGRGSTADRMQPGKARK